MRIIKKITNLRDYLYFNQISYKDFSEKCGGGMNPSMLSSFCKGKTIPRYETAKSIEKATHGVISAESLIRFCFEKKMEKLFKKDIETE